MATYDLYSILEKALKNSSSDLVTRQSGKLVRERIEEKIIEEKAGTIISLDFTRIGIVDYSCADEIIAKLMSRLISNEYGDKFIILCGLNEHQRENVVVALERKGLAVMAEMSNGKQRLMGTLNNYLKETLDIIIKKDKITAKELSEAIQLAANTSGTRLLNLYKKRLVKRAETMSDRGKIWVYEQLKKPG